MNAESLLNKGILTFRFYLFSNLKIFNFYYHFLTFYFLEANISGKTLSAINADAEDTSKKNAGNLTSHSLILIY